MSKINLIREPKIALLYDRVNTKYGGAEQVLLELHKIFPKAPLFTSLYDPQQASWSKTFLIKPSFLQKIPFFKRFHRSLVMLMPLAFETLQLKEFDVVISVTSAEAKGILTTPDQLHICYLLTPTRYLWSHQDEYQHHWATGWFRRIIFTYLKWWDTAAAWRPDVIIPISKLVKERTKKFYNRESLEPIYPPVSLAAGTSNLVGVLTQPYYLIVSRLVGYKRIDLAIQACQNAQKNLIIIGNGPDQSRLKRLINTQRSSITFLQSVQPDQIAAYYQHCTAFLAPGEEDFGIATIESLQAGKPVIVYFKSGSAELVGDQSGILLKEQTVSALQSAISELEKKVWNEKEIKQSITGHSAVQFQSQFKKVVDEQWSLFEKGKYV